MKNLGIIALFVFLLLGCEKEQEKEDILETGNILIRIENTSKFTYKDIKVKVDEEREYENLAAGETSGYRSFSRAYRYAYVELKINGKRYVLQPIDYFGEEKLKEGKYTYQITADKSSSEYGRLDLTFKKD